MNTLFCHVICYHIIQGFRVKNCWSQLNFNIAYILYRLHDIVLLSVYSVRVDFLLIHRIFDGSLISDESPFVLDFWKFIGMVYYNQLTVTKNMRLLFVALFLFNLWHAMIECNSLTRF